MTFDLRILPVAIFTSSMWTCGSIYAWIRTDNSHFLIRFYMSRFSADLVNRTFFLPTECTRDPFRCPLTESFRECQTSQYSLARFRGLFGDYLWDDVLFEEWRMIVWWRISTASKVSIYPSWSWCTAMKPKVRESRFLFVWVKCYKFAIFSGLIVETNIDFLSDVVSRQKMIILVIARNHPTVAEAQGVKMSPCTKAFDFCANCRCTHPYDDWESR